MLLFAPAFFIYLPFISSKDPPAAIFYVKASLFFIILLKIASIVICFIIRCTVLFFKIYEKGISFIEIMKKVLCNFFCTFVIIIKREHCWHCAIYIKLTHRGQRCKRGLSTKENFNLRKLKALCGY